MTKKAFDKARPAAKAAAKSAGAQTSTPSNQERVAAPQAEATQISAPQPAPAPTVSPRPQTWDTIGVGSLVLATAGRADGWWEARVTAVNGEVLTLTWCDFPGEGPILRRRTELALLPPTA